MTETKEGKTAGAELLLVDDMPANLELLSYMLKAGGYKTRLAASGAEALAACAAEPPELVLLDINMPQMDGYEVCRRLKADERLAGIPVIFLSALEETVDKVRAFEAGGVDYICKPFRTEEVEARVRAQLQLRRQGRLLERNYEQLKQLEKQRDGLVHMIVHDLRTPLAVILSYLDLLAKDAAGALPPAADEDVAAVRKAAEVMMRLVSDILDISKMESGKMNLSLADCDVRALAGKVAGEMSSLAGRRKLTAETGGGPVLVKADAELLCRVLKNLVSNALKFAPAGGGYVLLRAGAAPGGARVTVENNGPDIPAEFQQKIFEKFGQVTAGGVRHPYSTGLGLSFCKLAVEAHGGRIGVESSRGKPTVFWFELPAGA
ncbi:MAG TPA: hybrid sensor histidine kinase/response regulator [Elusimicrobiales bacterium]|nr:hybrid sensor histidine kinase/response regulator [Elusimicrobiales bacterium]